MAKLLKLRRGTTTQHNSFTGAEGEVTVDTDKETLVVHDGSTAGGHPVAAEDLANVSSSTIAGRLSNDSIAVSKIAAGTLPSDVKIQDANVSGNLTIATADINNDAVTNAKVADNAINTAQIVANAVTANSIAAGAVGSSELATGAVTHVKLANDCIDADNIQDDVINSEHYVDGSIDTAHIANDQVTFAKLQNVASQTIFGRAGGGTGDPTALSATDVRNIINVENGATADQTSTEIKSLLASDNLGSSHIGDDAIGASELADNAVLTSRIADSNVTTAKLATDAVTFAKIQNITTARILGNVSGSTGDVQQLSAANVRSMINVEDGATADQTGAEIASALNGQNIYTTGVIGRDGSDNLSFANDSYMNIHINGNNEFRFESDGDFHADGDVIAFSTTVSSDKKLKENIEVVPNALEKVQALDGVTFTWKRDGTPSAGVIAQEVQAVLPEAVKEVTPVKGGDSHLSVNYHALTSILIESIKELKAEIEQLKGGQ